MNKKNNVQVYMSWADCSGDLPEIDRAPGRAKTFRIMKLKSPASYGPKWEHS